MKSLHNVSANLKALAIESTEARCRAGASLSDAIQEAALIAIVEGRLVNFVHNERRYTADPVAIYATINETKS